MTVFTQETDDSFKEDDSCSLEIGWIGFVMVSGISLADILKTVEVTLGNFQ